MRNLGYIIFIMFYAFACNTNKKNVQSLQTNTNPQFNNNNIIKQAVNSPQPKIKDNAKIKTEIKQQSNKIQKLEDKKIVKNNAIDKAKNDKINSDKLGKHHLDEINKINIQFVKKIREERDIGKKAAYRKAREIQLKKVLGKKLYDEYKRKTTLNRNSKFR